MRKTKIVVTIGWLHNDNEILKKFIEMGTDIFRTNLSHHPHEWHVDLLRRLRKAIKESGRDIKIEADISGPKVRTGENPEGKYFIDLKQGERVILTTENPGKGKIHIPHSDIHNMVDIGGQIHIDDAAVQLKVLEKNNSEIVCESIHDCKLGARRTVVVPGKDFDLPTITDKDRKDMEFLSKQDIDYFGLSLVKSVKDVETVRQFFSERGRNFKILSKIETPEGIRNFNEIMKASDAIMVARGDMKVFMGVEKVPAIQADIIRKCNKAGKFVIVATEMLNSMKNNPIPTCAEANDVYNAVLAGADAVMLSGETTEGNHPIRSLEYMVKIVQEAEQNGI